MAFQGVRGGQSFSRSGSSGRASTTITRTSTKALKPIGSPPGGYITDAGFTFISRIPHNISGEHELQFYRSNPSNSLYIPLL